MVYLIKTNRVGQVLINLLGNAFKFTQEGYVSLKISKLFEDQVHVVLLFIVEDSGVGVPER